MDNAMRKARNNVDCWYDVELVGAAKPATKATQGALNPSVDAENNCAINGMFGVGYITERQRMQMLLEAKKAGNTDSTVISRPSYFVSVVDNTPRFVATRVLKNMREIRMADIVAYYQTHLQRSNKGKFCLKSFTDVTCVPNIY